MALYGKLSEESIDHGPPFSEVHKKDLKAKDRRHSVKWVPRPVVNESASEPPKNKK